MAPVENATGRRNLAQLFITPNSGEWLVYASRKALDAEKGRREEQGLVDPKSCQRKDWFIQLAKRHRT